jgi:hypothetical protein
VVLIRFPKANDESGPLAVGDMLYHPAHQLEGIDLYSGALSIAVLISPPKVSPQGRCPGKSNKFEINKKTKNTFKLSS